MNAILKVLVLTGAGCMISFIGGCASSSLFDKWHDPSFQVAPLDKMLIISVRKDATKRRIWEDAFANELVKHGVAATSSYSLFPDAPPDTSQVDSAVKAIGFDAILIATRRPTQKTTQLIEGYTTTREAVLYSFYWQTYRTYYHEIEHPGYIDTFKVAINTIDVLTTGKDGRLIWSATSRTPDPNSVTDVQQGIVGLVTSDLTQRNIIRSEK
ncbi:MAG: hypothetical protein MUF22_02145 [Chitinispirillaceae bacterium]|jgi:hypothetical protein|nr:hypothetical protein [Chitinispirillaceae bacterium]